MDGLQSLYETKGDVAFWGDHWCGPDTLHHAEKTLVATFAGEEDGADVAVYMTAMPTRFYTIACGDNCLDTGSGMQKEARQIAEALATGMLSISAFPESMDS